MFKFRSCKKAVKHRRECCLGWHPYSWRYQNYPKCSMAQRMKLIRKEIKTNGLPFKKSVTKTLNQGIESIVHIESKVHFRRNLGNWKNGKMVSSRSAQILVEVKLHDAVIAESKTYRQEKANHVPVGIKLSFTEFTSKLLVTGSGSSTLHLCQETRFRYTGFKSRPIGHVK